MYNETVESIYALPKIKPPKLTKKSQKLCDIHIHTEYELLTIRGGAIKCVAQGKEIIGRAGDLIFVNSNIPHITYDEEGSTNYALVQFNSPTKTTSALRYACALSTSDASSVLVLKCGEPSTEFIKELVEKLLKERLAHSEFWRDYVQGYIILIYAALKRLGAISELSKEKISKLEKILPIIEFINENYGVELSTSSLAEILKLNETYFCRIFKSAVGITPLAYLNFVRISNAEELLAKGESISDIAYKCGFSSLSYFNRTFKKVKGYSPRQYREIIKNNKQKIALPE